MKRFQLVASAVVLAAMASMMSGVASGQSKCSNPSGSVEQRACAMAAAGPDALRRFIERTRGIYGLYYGDFASSDW